MLQSTYPRTLLPVLPQHRLEESIKRLMIVLHGLASCQKHLANTVLCIQYPGYSEKFTVIDNASAWIWYLENENKEGGVNFTFKDV